MPLLEPQALPWWLLLRASTLQWRGTLLGTRRKCLMWGMALLHAALL
jgi:hypothetical protein